VFHLPIEIPYVRRSKRPFYVIYAILSGLYGYSLLSFLMVITYHILLKYSPEWAFVPALAIGYWVFRARITHGVKFMKTVYLDKKESLRAWLGTRLGIAFGVAICLTLFLPIWPEFVKAPFLLEPWNRVQLHATVPGTVSGVFVKEGDQIKGGDVLLTMRNLQLESERDAAKADEITASAKATQALLRYADLGAAEQQQRQTQETRRVLSGKMAELTVLSPIAGTVVTPRPADLVGSSPDEGDPLLEISDMSRLRARIYIPEFAMHDIRPGTRVCLQLPGRFRSLNATLTALSPVEASVPGGLIPREQLQGINPPHFYTGMVLLDNDGTLHEAASGTAKILVRKASIAEQTWRFSRDLVDRRIW
jgi:biotin carboxyl carrier protein